VIPEAPGTVLASAPVKTGRKEKMKELCAEGLATSGVPESCVYSREAVGEALTGAGAGRVLSREKKLFRAPTLLAMAEGNTCDTASPTSAVQGVWSNHFGHLGSPVRRLALHLGGWHAQPLG
jgi:hypothetical protein